ncbi:aldehyde dehydrogenase [Acinetobacter defluvii]|uniref:coniferyl aldehyde dehydrogenase n=1 Tax=Acinetobacter defluvii TaxID=1871111 RepID=UPI00148FE002|nr:coniferyl aldehyde dehydrogenase [Acinetobacter defluvii]NNP73087.1 aldehyde dehydrogenase [Acinetobacter defluvii]
MNTVQNIEIENDRQNLSNILNVQRQAFLNQDFPTLRERKAKLAQLKTAVLKYRGQLQQAIHHDFGNRAFQETDVMELVGVIQSIDYLSRNLKRFMKPERRHVSLFYRSAKAHVEYQPKGIIGIMAPWNYPVSLTLIPLATALAAGNRAMLKPSELTPRTSDVLQKMLHEIFNPDEVTVILGGPEVGAEFSQLAFDHLFFTGSTPVGHKVMEAASKNLVPITLELGGKSPVIVARGHVNARTVQSIAYGKLSNGGQTCVAPDYALIHENDLEQFIEQYDQMVKRFYPEGPTSKDYTSIVNERHFQRLNHLLEDAKNSGAQVLAVGVNPESAQNRNRTIAPTLVIGANDIDAIMREEIFGPILPIRTYRDLDETIEYINARPRPLALYYFGEKNADCEKVLKCTTSGNVGINNTIIHVAQDDLPFGGVGASGMGAYHGIEGFRSMSHSKGVYDQGRFNFPTLLHAPFGKFMDLALRFTLSPKP